MPINEKKAVSIKEFANIMGISPTHAWRLVTDEKVPSIRLGNRHCIPMTAIKEMLGEVSDTDEPRISA